MTKNKIVEFIREQICSLIFPARCPVCDEILTPEQIEKGIHLECESKLYPVKGAVCMHCGRPLGQRFLQEKENRDEYIEQNNAREYCYECIRKGYVTTKNSNGIQNSGSYITQAKALYLYRGVIKQTIYRLKYSNKREYAAFFAKQVETACTTWLGQGCNPPRSLNWFSKIDVIVPVPMYLPKQKRRGYNQAETFAQELSKRTGIPVDTELVKRVIDTTPQKELNDRERKNNLKNAFQKGKSIVQYSHALVVDDIYTTGSTAEAVAEVLKKIGVCQVYLLTICIGGDV